MVGQAIALLAADPGGELGFEVDLSGASLNDSAAAAHRVRGGPHRIARGLGKETIAEFISTPELEAFVRDQGVDFAQGFEVGRPAPIAELGLGRSAAPARVS